MAKQTYNNVKKSHSIVVASSRVADLGKRKVEKGINKAVSKIQQQNTFETDTLASTITTTQKVVTTVEVSRSTADQIVRTAPVVAKAVKTGAKGVYNVGKGTLKVAGKGIILAYGVKTGVIRPGHDILERMRRLKESGGLSRKVSAILHAAPKMIFRTAVKGVKTGGVVAGRTIKTGGKVLTKVGKSGLRQAVRMTDSLLSSGGTFETEVAAATWKTMRFTVKAAAATPKVAKAGYKGAKTAIKASIKTGRFAVKTSVGAFKATRRGIRVIRRAGFKGALKVYTRRLSRSIRVKTIKIFRKAGHSVVSATVSIIKKLLTKIILPIIVLIAIVVGIETIINAVAGCVTVIFSPFVSSKDGDDGKVEEIDERDWLSEKIGKKRDDLVGEVISEYNEKISTGCHIVRFYDATTDKEFELSNENIDNCFYSSAEYLEFIEPIFHTIMYSEYELQPTTDQMQTEFDKIWEEVSIIKVENLPDEYCHMNRIDNDDGTYTIERIEEEDHNVHADPNTCPNCSSQQFHSPGVEKCSCDKWVCPGHQWLSCTLPEHTHSDECYSIDCGRTENRNRRKGPLHEHSDECKSLDCVIEEHTHNEWCYGSDNHGESANEPPCDESVLQCTGYYICQGHQVAKISIETKGLGELLDQYYVKKIKDLESKSSLTEAESKDLSKLKECYEMCLSYIDVLAEEYGVGSNTIEDFDKSTITDSFASVACEQIGSQYIRGGSDPSIGFDSDGFVYYVYSSSIDMPRKGSDQVKIGTTISSITDAKAGDLIFWSSNQQDDGVYHVAIYLGNNLIVHASNSAPYPRGGVKVSDLTDDDKISNEKNKIYKIQRVTF